jgi:polyisoprenoid-binding protein YceI
MKSNSYEILNSESLRHWLESNPEGLLINVLPEDAFDEARIPGSKNACTYEMAFIETMKRLAPDPNAELVVYGESGKTLEADAAIEKLKQAGYLNAKIFKGGLAAWKEAGFPVEGLGVSLESAITPADGNYRLDTSSSVIRWTGRNLFNHHEGSLKLSSGSADLKGGNLESAQFAIDMNAITCGDISDSQMNGMLITHLKSEDFFWVDEFPSASFVSRSVSPIAGATPGSKNWTVTGDLTLRGVTAEVTFPAVVAMKPEGILVAQAEFSIDRTRWGVVYGSGKFFARLAHHVVNDDVQLHLKLFLLPPT